MEYSAKVPVPLSVVITKEGKWFVAACPVLDIATQGKDEKEVIENMKDLVEEYFEDPGELWPSPQTKQFCL